MSPPEALDQALAADADPDLLQLGGAERSREGIDRICDLRVDDHASGSSSSAAC